MRTPAHGDEVTKEWLEEILSQYECRSRPGTSVSVTSFEVTPGVSHGENFSSQLMKIVVKARRNTDGHTADAETPYNLLAKFLPGTAMEHEASKHAKGPLKEVLTYRDVIPALNAFQAETGDGNYIVNIPSYIHGVCRVGEFVLVMEDLRPSGYRNNDKRNGLGLNQILLAIEKLAVLHGVSYAYNERHNFLEKFPDFRVGDHLHNVMVLFFFSLFEMLIAALAKTEYNELAEKMRRNKSFIKNRFASLFEVQNHQMKCLCHGDFWNNNLLFNSENEEAIVFLDWGNPHWYSPVLDVQYLIHTSTTLDLRKSHEEEILQRYHSTFTTVTTDLGAPAPFWTFEAFKSEYEKFGLYGVVMGAIVSATSLSTFAEKFTKQRDTVSHADSSSMSWKIGARIGKIVGSLSFIRPMHPLFKYNVKKTYWPFYEEIATGENKVQSTRVFDLLNEAEKKGLFGN